MVVASYRKDVDFVLVNRLESLHRNSVARLTDRLNITLVADWAVKAQHKNNTPKKEKKKKNKIIFTFYRPSCSVMNARLYNTRTVTHLARQWLWAGFLKIVFSSTC